jgi:hypothetical protein
VTDSSGTVRMSQTHFNLLGGHEVYKETFNVGIMPEEDWTFLVELLFSSGFTPTPPSDVVDTYNWVVYATNDPPDKPPLQKFQSYLPWIIGGVAVIGLGVVLLKTRRQ